MNDFERTIDRQGTWLRNALELISDHNAADVLPYFFPLEIIDEYVVQRKEALKSEILAVLRKKQYWKDTGTQITFDSDFFCHYLQFEGTITQFKAVLSKGKVSTEYLRKVHRQMVDEPEFCNKSNGRHWDESH